MTDEQKELLSNDLSARLPYRVKIKTDYYQTATLISIRKNISLNSGKDLSVTYDISGKDEPFQMEERWGTPISEIKPYLFPMSSMTEEQRAEYESLCIKETSEYSDLYGIIFAKDHYYDTIESIDYLYKNHIDVRGLIPMGLAIDATGLGIYR